MKNGIHKTSILMIATVSLGLFFAGCTTTYYLTPVIEEDSGQSLFYADGKEVAISNLEQTAVALYVLKTTKNELLIHVLYQNNSDSPINIFPDQIKIEFTDRYGNSGNMFVYTTEDYLKKLKRAQAWQKVALALGAMSDAMSAGTSKTYGTVGGQPVYVETYDPAKQALINKQNQREMERVTAQHAIINAAVENGLLKRNTLMPGYYVEGNVMAKFRNTDRCTISIPFGSDIHILRFTRQD